MALRRSALCLSCLESLRPLTPDLLTLSLGLWDAQRHLRSSCPQGVGQSLWFLGHRLNQVWTQFLLADFPVGVNSLLPWGEGVPRGKGSLVSFSKIT